MSHCSKTDYGQARTNVQTPEVAGKWQPYIQGCHLPTTSGVGTFVPDDPKSVCEQRDVIGLMNYEND